MDFLKKTYYNVILPDFILPAVQNIYNFLKKTFPVLYPKIVVTLYFIWLTTDQILYRIFLALGKYFCFILYASILFLYFSFSFKNKIETIFSDIEHLASAIIAELKQILKQIFGLINEFSLIK